MRDFLSCFAPPVVTDFYCIQVFGKSINSTQIAKLDKLRHRAAKITTIAMKFTNREKLFADLGWENYKTRIEYLSICLFHKIHIYETRPQIRECLSVSDKPALTADNYSFFFSAVEACGMDYNLEWSS